MQKPCTSASALQTMMSLSYRSSVRGFQIALNEPILLRRNVLAANIRLNVLHRKGVRQAYSRRLVPALRHGIIAAVNDMPHGRYARSAPNLVSSPHT